MVGRKRSGDDRYNLARRRQYQYDARRQQGDGGGVFGDSQFTQHPPVNFRQDPREEPVISHATDNANCLMVP